MTPALALRLAWGTLLLAAPDAPLRALGAADDDRARATARILGARHLLVVALLHRHRGEIARYTAAAVDATHALSMVALAALDAGRRRAAAADAVTAATFAGLTAAG